MVVEACVGDTGKLQILGQIGTVERSAETRVRGRTGCSLEVLLFIDNLNAMFEVGCAILADRGKVAVDRHLVWRCQRSVDVGRAQGGRGHRRLRRRESRRSHDERRVIQPCPAADKECVIRCSPREPASHLSRLSRPTGSVTGSCACGCSKVASVCW
jgi:hypothetical protein